jgi:hypothetical protein
MHASTSALLGQSPLLLGCLFLSLALLVPTIPGCGKCEEAYSLAFDHEPSRVTSTLRDIAIIDPHAEFHAAVAVGDDGLILTRSPGVEGGWTQRKSGLNANLLAVAASYGDIPYVVACGAGGVILRSPDTGETWEQLDLDIDIDIYDVIVEFELAIAVGERTVLRSEDAGKSWHPAEVPSVVKTGGILRSVSSGDQGSVIAVGDSGLAIGSSDRGLTWRHIDTDTTTDLAAVGPAWRPGSNSYTFLVIGAHGFARRMANESGTLWEDVDLGTEADLLSISTHGDWILASDGSILTPQWEGGLGPHFPSLKDSTAKLLRTDGSALEAWLVGTEGEIIRAQTNNYLLGRARIARGILKH